MAKQETKVVVDEVVRDVAGAYLWMGKALEAHDPASDRWSEPTEFGDAAQRRKRAEGALEGALSLAGGSRTKLEADRSRFFKALDELNAGAPFGPAHRDLLRSFRREGMSLFSKSVSKVEQAGASG